MFVTHLSHVPDVTNAAGTGAGDVVAGAGYAVMLAAVMDAECSTMLTKNVTCKLDVIDVAGTVAVGKQKIFKSDL